jgi:NAD(P)-dependent dehydrogenase (short-subunit alcohol dehydrogenase family)
MNADKLFDLKGRVAVVTGALGKLGVFWTETLLKAGASILAVDRKEALISEAFRALERRFRKKVLVARADIRRRSDLERIEMLGRRTLGVPGIVVNNAGIDQPPAKLKKAFRFEDIPAEVIRETMDVNLVGALQVLQVFGEDLMQSKHGSVINIGSLYSVHAPDPRLYDHIPQDPPFLKPPAYGASKAALVNLTKYLAALWGPKGVRVNALSPGGVKAGQDAEFQRKYNAKVPLGRMARIEDLAGPLLFLASDASSYVSGVNLMVDGGFSVW